MLDLQGQKKLVDNAATAEQRKDPKRIDKSEEKKKVQCLRTIVYNQLSNNVSKGCVM